MNDDDAYASIADHAAIGNLLTVALVATDGTIDWCCLPELDSPSVFASLLDCRRGGRFRIGVPRALERARAQRYLPETNVCETRFETPTGALTVVDFMPLRGDLVLCNDPITRPEIHRVLTATGGPVDVRGVFRGGEDGPRRGATRSDDHRGSGAPSELHAPPRHGPRGRRAIWLE